MAQQQVKNKENTVAQWEVIVADIEEDFNKIAVIDNLVQFEKEGKFALQIITGGNAAEYLQRCSSSSIRNAITNVAAVGLTLNPAMKLAYLVPRDGQCCLDISYIGLKKLATDSGAVLDAAAEIVRANDEFVYNGPFAPPVHKYNPFDSDDQRGDIIGVYVWAKLGSGLDRIEPLDIAEIRKIRDKSKAKSGPWQDWFEEMAKKAAMKRASKNWPRTERLSLAESILNEHEGNAEPIGGTRIKRDNADDIATQAQQAAAQQAAQGVDVDALRAWLIGESKKGMAAYKLAWQGLTPQERKVFAADHDQWKKDALNADVSDVDFKDSPTTQGAVSE